MRDPAAFAGYLCSGGYRSVLVARGNLVESAKEDGRFEVRWWTEGRMARFASNRIAWNRQPSVDDTLLMHLLSKRTHCNGMVVRVCDRKSPASSVQQGPSRSVSKLCVKQTQDSFHLFFYTVTLDLSFPHPSPLPPFSWITQT